MAVGDILWEPPADVRKTSRVGRFLDRVEREHGLDLPTYDAAWRWSVASLDPFWSAVLRDAEVAVEGDPSTVRSGRMPGTRWFPDLRLNYAQHALRTTGSGVAVLARSDTRDDISITYDELRGLVARCAAGLRRLGVEPGDRVVGYLPNIPEAIVAFLATASVGAVWSSCAPEFGTRSVIDRVQQIEPTVLLAVDGYRYGDRAVDRGRELRQIRDALPTLRGTVVLEYLGTQELPADVVTWDDLLSSTTELATDPVPFDHPLYVLYSSGTTGLPKAIVHGHGGILLEHHKALALHTDLGPGDRFFWFSTTGWMMWNYLVSGLIVGATVVLFDGNPSHPDLMALWRLAADLSVTYLGLGAPFVTNCARERLSPASEVELGAVRGVGSTGAPLPPEGFRWVYEHVGSELVLGSLSGGTDLCTGFVGPSPLLPVREGEITCRFLGAKVEAWSPAGAPLVGETGELVITEPMPSMPVGFWNDPDGSRYQAAYFEDFPGVWRHGDWIEITPRGSVVITGRSDSTLNRGGVRMGTAEFYAAVESLPEISDSLVIHLDQDGADELLLFVVPSQDAVLDAGLRDRIRSTLRAELSPRHVPDHISAIDVVPRTISGKKMEVPVKRILAGTSVEEAANPGAMQDPSALDPFLGPVGHA